MSPSKSPHDANRFAASMKNLPLLSLLLCLACARPPIAPGPVVLPEQAPSEIVLQITLPLSAVKTGIESEVPKRLRRTDDFEMDASNRFGAQYLVERDPIRAGVRGDRLQTVIRFRYGIRACHRTPTGLSESRMWPCVACGLDEPLREAVVILDSALRWDPALFVRSTTSVGAIEFYDRCRVSFFRLDITDWKVRPFIEAQVRASASQIDARIRSASSVANEVRRLWSAASEPVEVGPRTWLVLAPQGVRVGPFTGDAETVRTTVTLIARPRIFVGSEKPVVTTAAMPAATVGAADTPALRVPFSIELPFAEAEPILEKRLKKPVRIERAADGRITLVTENARLSGKPIIDNGAVAVPDLDYRVGGLFRRTADSLRHAEVRDRLREKARWDLTPMLSQFRGALERGLRARQIDAKVTSVQPTAIHVLADRFVIDAAATGSAEVVIRRP